MYTDLTNAVIAQLGLKDRWGVTGDDHESTMRDVARGGADAGFHGFIYYHETCAFYDANAELIWEALCDDAEAFGQTPMQIIAGFKSYINDDTSFKNVLAWYALERAADEVVDALEVTK